MTRILVQITIHRRLPVGRDGHLNWDVILDSTRGEGVGTITVSSSTLGRQLGR